MKEKQNTYLITMREGPSCYRDEVGFSCVCIANNRTKVKKFVLENACKWAKRKGFKIENKHAKWRLAQQEYAFPLLNPIQTLVEVEVAFSVEKIKCFEI